ncbi:MULTISPECIES: enoyl-CoA hydratase/isomerase family protein [unclassified Solwaraspora]|uniref:enoyl-CoA hydratase/isomerase family protein n=1 Tax=unclassified Solwaraspora TaxID=2627926 RepID=UPI00259BEDC1|nr:enoyl-CoA hydratase/isomerase family protein [Solwaraspora sp. WMMA2056]WJK39580.1 enoyl-CoA hydratase/isomerase family protein [Solwaraspora sp. WMMA2056]
MKPPSTSTLTLTRHGRVLLVTLDRPHRLNAYDRVMVDELRRTWRWFGADDGLHVAVLTGAGERGFCTGFDVDDTLDAGVTSPSLDHAGRVALTARDLGVYKPVVTAVNGHCCAGGWHFVNDADVVLCTETATFFDTHHDVGLANPVEAVGALGRLPLGELMRMVLTGRAYRIDARRALELGLVTEVTAPADLVDRALAIATEIAQHPLDVLTTTVETVWTAVQAQRSAAEGFGLAMLARSDASTARRGESMREFRH